MKKKILNILWIGLILGIILVFIQQISGIDSKEFLSYYWKIGIIVIIIFIVISIIYYIFYTRKMNINMKLFYEEKYDEYIKEMEKLLDNTWNKEIKNIIKINLSAGYIEIKEYNKALILLSDVDSKAIKNEKVKLPLYINLAIANFRLGNYEEFKSIYLNNKELFMKYIDNKNYVESISQLDIFYNIVEGRYEEANNLLEKLINKYKNTKNMDDYIELRKIIKENMK